MKNPSLNFPASRLPLLFQCPASASQCCGTGKGSYQSESTEKGTRMHYKFEQNVNAYVHGQTPPYDLKEYEPALQCLMTEYAKAKAVDPNTVLLSEYEGKYVNQYSCYGRMDAAVVSQGKALILDLKTGQRPIDPLNPILLAYCLVLLNTVPTNLKPHEFTLAIYQPTKNLQDGFKIAHVSDQDVLHWAYEKLLPILADANSDHPTYVYGAHCKDCSAHKRCPYYRQSVLDIKDLIQKPLSAMTSQELEHLWDAIEAVETLKGQVKEEMEFRLTKNEKFEHHILKEKVTHRKWDESSEEKIISTLEDMGLETKQYSKLKSPAAVQKAIGNDQKFQEKLGKYVSKSTGEKTLSEFLHI